MIISLAIGTFIFPADKIPQTHSAFKSIGLDLGIVGFNQPQSHNLFKIDWMLSEWNNVIFPSDSSVTRDGDGDGDGV